MKYVTFPYIRKILLLICLFPVLLLPSNAREFPASRQPVNILLIGRDDHAGTGNGRSDCILLCTYQPEQQTLTMTSILRDLYVSIPGHRDNRINAAFAYGGMDLLERTVEENFRVAVDGSILVDFTRFPPLIDLLGGVVLALRADEAEAINETTRSDLTAGKHLLNGDQALAYVRIRKLDNDGDFSRTGRQRKLLQALVESYRSASLPQILQVLEKAVSLVETNLSRRQIFQTVFRLTPQLSGLRLLQQHVPAEGTYEYRTIRGMCVLVADMDAARALLSATLTPPTK